MTHESELRWPQDFRHMDIKGRPVFTWCDGEHCAAKDGQWYKIIPLEQDDPGRGMVMTPRKVVPLEDSNLLDKLGSADEYLERVATSELRQELRDD